MIDDPDSSGESPNDALAPALIQEPLSTGVDPVQGKIERADQVFTPAAPGALREFADVLVDLDGHYLRGASYALVCAILARVEGELRNERERNAKLSEQLDRVRDAYHTEKEGAAVLRERIVSLEYQHHLQAAVITLGALVAGLAVPHVIETGGRWAWMGAVLGVLLLALGWAIPFFRRSRS